MPAVVTAVEPEPVLKRDARGRVACARRASGLTIVTLEDDEEVTRPPLPFAQAQKLGVLRRFCACLVLTWRRAQAPELVI